MIRVLFVCLGNICRSPTAEGIFRQLVEDQNLSERIEADSAGTHAYHVGEPPDARAQAAAARRGVDLSVLRGRLATRQDIEEFDYILAMDRGNLDALLSITPSGMDHKVKLLMEFAPNARAQDVPDPYYGGTAGFDQVIDMLEEAAQGLLEELRRRL